MTKTWGVQFLLLLNEFSNDVSSHWDSNSEGFQSLGII